MKALLVSLSLLLSSSGADDLAPKTVKQIKVSVPAAWYHGRASYWPGVWAANGADRWTAPTLDAYMTVDVDTVKRQGMSAQDCRDQIVRELGKRGFTLMKLGGQPAARRVETDYDDHAELFVSHTYIGCDGHSTFAISFHFVEKRRDRFEALSLRIAESMRYLPRVD